MRKFHCHCKIPKATRTFFPKLRLWPATSRFTQRSTGLPQHKPRVSNVVTCVFVIYLSCGAVADVFSWRINNVYKSPETRDGVCLFVCCLFLKSDFSLFTCWQWRMQVDFEPIVETDRELTSRWAMELSRDRRLCGRRDRIQGEALRPPNFDLAELGSKFSRCLYYCTQTLLLYCSSGKQKKWYQLFCWLFVTRTET